uniref:Uncharacterized protein n=2 Tax=Caenorhabditis japonica TaxID=281687 RepID=A0A8R1IRN1_CAEJA
MKSLTSPGTATFIETFCEKQLQMFLKKKGSAIIDAHERIRAGSANFEPHDIRRFPGYQGLIEDNSEYEEGKVNLICTLSSDGARLKRLSRREATPILLRLEGLDLADKASGSSMVIIGIVFADGGVKKHLIDDFVKLAVSRVSTMTVSVTLSGRFFEFRMTITAPFTNVVSYSARLDLLCQTSTSNFSTRTCGQHSNMAVNYFIPPLFTFQESSSHR